MLSKLSLINVVLLGLLLIAVESAPSSIYRPGRPLKRSYNAESYAVDTSSSDSDAGPPTAATDDPRPQSVDVPLQRDLDVPPRPSRWHFGPGGIWTRLSLVDEDVLNALQQADVPPPSTDSRH